MTTHFLLDNSVAMAWCFDDKNNSYARDALFSFENAKALVPVVWPLEFGNAMLVAERNKRLNTNDVAQFQENVRKLPITVIKETPARVFKEIFNWRAITVSAPMTLTVKEHR